jgi:F0F1-type ATP synthase membrane subunit c/vacuolar-type H+-ATPase subunit K
MRILWAVFLTNVGLFVVVTRFVRADSGAADAGVRDNPTLLYALAAAGLASVALSFVLKAGFYGRGAERQEPAQVQTGFILALALCEAAALLGVVGLFVTWNDYAYLLFALGALGMILHFPRREQVQAAYYKSTA